MLKQKKSDAKPRVLLLEDDEILLPMYILKFKNAGIPFDAVPTASEALELLQQKDYSLLLLDILLGDKNGFEVLQIIRDNHRYDSMDIWVFSNVWDKVGENRAFDMGAQRYIIKSHYIPDEVARQVVRYLENESSTD